MRYESGRLSGTFWGSPRFCLLTRKELSPKKRPYFPFLFFISRTAKPSRISVRKNSQRDEFRLGAWFCHYKRLGSPKSIRGKMAAANQGRDFLRKYVRMKTSVDRKGNHKLNIAVGAWSRWMVYPVSSLGSFH